MGTNKERCFNCGKFYYCGDEHKCLTELEIPELTAKDYLFLGKCKKLKSIKQKQSETLVEEHAIREQWDFLEVEQL